jgi:hypothetical protein
MDSNVNGALWAWCPMPCSLTPNLRFPPGLDARDHVRPFNGSCSSSTTSPGHASGRTVIKSRVCLPVRSVPDSLQSLQERRFRSPSSVRRTVAVIAGACSAMSLGGEVVAAVSHGRSRLLAWQSVGRPGGRIQRGLGPRGCPGPGGIGRQPCDGPLRSGVMTCLQRCWARSDHEAAFELVTGVGQRLHLY